ncbi:MAG: hypothetical protein IBX55_13060 [Methyloprofundus sp.]|nr:hypothetical protein [Methyloprofundus sp.]
MLKETPQKVIYRLNALIDDRKPDDYSEMLVNQADIMYLTEPERQQFHDAKMALPSREDSARAAKDRNLARVKLRRELKTRACWPEGIKNGLYST